RRVLQEQPAPPRAAIIDAQQTEERDHGQTEFRWQKQQQRAKQRFPQFGQQSRQQRTQRRQQEKRRHDRGRGGPSRRPAYGGDPWPRVLRGDRPPGRAESAGESPPVRENEERRRTRAQRPQPVRSSGNERDPGPG